MALFQNTHPTITTVSQSGIKMGNRRKMLIDRLESEEEHDEEENYKTK
jgi:LacI family transcriptional regulator